ncbi:MAG TPA: prepilin-type N-terminal cleavage/methylation domain-containing protein [Rhodanobacteraceae bacterium]|nr:prepilin-type N-terminal cleavage/methylation domain-containing protein [Rhodanobacteraceae bacterium]
MMRRERGFTLIEVLVAILLLSLLLAGAWGGIHTATKAIRAGDALIERMNRLRVTQQFLRRQLSHAMPLAFGQDRGTGLGYVFQGEKDFMRFVAPMPGYLSKGGAYVQTLEFSRSGSHAELLFTNLMLNGFDLDKLGSDDLKPVLLLDGIARGHFEYRGLDDDGQLDKWQDTWDDPGKLPVMVRIDLEMRADSGMHWPTMEIPLMLDIGAMSPRMRSVPIPGMSQPRGAPTPPVQPRGKADIK